MAGGTLEERVDAMEQELAQLKQQLQASKTEDAAPWWQQITGVFKDCPEFDEAMRLGREWREAQNAENAHDGTQMTEPARGSA